MDQLTRWCSDLDTPVVLAFVAHPDDDVLGFGGRLSFVASEIHIAYLSDGAPARSEFYTCHGFRTRIEYARARRREAHCALELAGVPSSRVCELGAVDQQVAYDLSRLTNAAKALIERVEPEVVLTHAYEGGHPDHDAAACLVHAALRQIARTHSQRPALIEFPSYHQQNGALVYGEFLPVLGTVERSVSLDAAARGRKLRMLQCHSTQIEVWRNFPLEVERFRVAPEYDFTHPPGAPFHYDEVDWGVSGEQFLGRARGTLHQLGIDGPC